MDIGQASCGGLMFDSLKDIQALAGTNHRGRRITVHGASCFFLNVNKKAALRTWQQLSDVATKTGYVPVFASNNILYNWNFESETDFFAPSRLAPGCQTGAVHTEEIADAFNQPDLRAKIAAILEKSDGSDAALNFLLNQNNPILNDILQALLNKPEFRRASADMAVIERQIIDNSQFLSALPSIMQSYTKSKKFESDALIEHQNECDNPTFENFIKASKSFSVEDWLAIKQNPILRINNDLATNEQIKLSELSQKLLLLPVSNISEIAAFLRLGNWEDNPPPHVHIALWKRWNERFGSVPIMVGLNSLEMVVKAPIQSRKVAIEMAFEHAAYSPYCAKRSENNEGDSRLAAELEGAAVWQFYWD
jgi:hypothetical protein